MRPLAQICIIQFIVKPFLFHLITGRFIHKNKKTMKKAYLVVLIKIHVTTKTIHIIQFINQFDGC